MAYPGRWARGLDPSVEDVPMMYEWVPVDQATNAPLSHSLGLVHFDLDIQNSKFLEAWYSEMLLRFFLLMQRKAWLATSMMPIQQRLSLR